METLELAINFLKKRAIETKHLETKMARQQLISVLPASEVEAVLSMVLSGEFIEFYNKQKEAGNPACS